MSKQGGKSTHLTAKKTKTEKNLDEDDIAFKKKQQEEKKAMQAMAAKTKAKGGPIATGGIGSKKK
ncbi:hypothetical protein DIPPA_24015 [Diplonema papillatum]|nr:hypothetical protein DIPPA_24015 [Diplonema papillatum]